MSNINQDSNQEAEIDLKELLFKFISYWYYYVVSFVFILAIAFIYIRYSTPVYEVESTLLVNKESSSGAMPMFEGMDFFKQKDDIAGEIDILKSVKLAKQAIGTLDLAVSYFVEGKIKNGEVYGIERPFRVEVNDVNKGLYQVKVSVKFNSPSEYQLDYSYIPRIEDMYKVERDTGSVVVSHTGTVGERCVASGLDIKVILNPSHKDDITENNYIIKFNSEDDLLQKYAGLRVLETSPRSGILKLSIRDNIPERSIDYLNTLSNAYINNGLEEKNRTYKNSIAFINKQMSKIQDSIQSATDKLLSFSGMKMANLDGNESTDRLAAFIREIEERKKVLERQNNDFSIAISDLNEGDSPSTLLTANTELEELFRKLSELKAEKLTLSSFATAKSPDLKLVNEQINKLEERIEVIIDKSLSANQNVILDLEKDLKSVQGTINDLYITEKEYLMAKRKYDIANDYYSFLLEKKTETEISQASTTPDDQILDEAQAFLTQQVLPRKGLVYALAMVIALILPSVLILVKESLDTKLYTQEELTKITDIPILGSVLFNTDTNILSSPKSAFAESFRALRVNLQFLLPKSANTEEAKIIGLTSTISGEGKTFCAYNLSVILSLSGKKVLLIGADLRKPKLFEYFNQEHKGVLGFTDYLVGEISHEEAIKSTDLENMNVMHSGSIPPNPVELLESEQTAILLSELKQEYDYIIIDNAPVGLVSDYFVLQKHFDHSIYVVKSDYSDTRFVENLHAQHKEGKFQNISVILNGVKKMGSYGYGYGYGYGNTYGYGYYEEATGKK